MRGGTGRPPAAAGLFRRYPPPHTHGRGVQGLFAVVARGFKTVNPRPTAHVCDSEIPSEAYMCVVVDFAIAQRGFNLQSAVADENLRPFADASL
jgi:hypothetical protein